MIAAYAGAMESIMATATSGSRLVKGQGRTIRRTDVVGIIPFMALSSLQLIESLNAATVNPTLLYGI